VSNFLRVNLLLVLIVVFWSPSFCLAGRLLIDDFSLDQEGISTDQFAEFDTIEFDSPIGTHRRIWGGGNSVSEDNCLRSEMTVSVSNGSMFVTSGDDCDGVGFVNWVDPFNNVNLSQYQTIQVEIGDVAGVVRSRINFTDETSLFSYIDTSFDAPGVYSFDFADFVGLGPRWDDGEVRFLGFAFGVDRGEFIAIDSVSLVVPEPHCLMLALLGLCVGSSRRKTASYLRWGINRAGAATSVTASNSSSDTV